MARGESLGGRRVYRDAKSTDAASKEFSIALWQGSGEGVHRGLGLRRSARKMQPLRLNPLRVGSGTEQNGPARVRSPNTRGLPCWHSGENCSL